MAPRLVPARIGRGRAGAGARAEPLAKGEQTFDTGAHGRGRSTPPRWPTWSTLTRPLDAGPRPDRAGAAGPGRRWCPTGAWPRGSTVVVEGGPGGHLAGPGPGRRALGRRRVGGGGGPRRPGPGRRRRGRHRRRPPGPGGRAAAATSGPPWWPRSSARSTSCVVGAPPAGAHGRRPPAGRPGPRAGHGPGAGRGPGATLGGAAPGAGLEVDLRLTVVDAEWQGLGSGARPPAGPPGHGRGHRSPPGRPAPPGRAVAARRPRPHRASPAASATRSPVGPSSTPTPTPGPTSIGWSTARCGRWVRLMARSAPWWCRAPTGRCWPPGCRPTSRPRCCGPTGWWPARRRPGPTGCTSGQRRREAQGRCPGAGRARARRRPRRPGLRGGGRRGRGVHPPHRDHPARGGAPCPPGARRATSGATRRWPRGSLERVDARAGRPGLARRGLGGGGRRPLRRRPGRRVRRSGAAAGGVRGGAGRARSRRFLAPLPVAVLDRGRPGRPRRRWSTCSGGWACAPWATWPRCRRPTWWPGSGSTARPPTGWPGASTSARPTPGIPPPVLRVEAELDPPAERVDTAAFVAKSLADDLHARLDHLGLACTRVAHPGRDRARRVARAAVAPRGGADPGGHRRPGALAARRVAQRLGRPPPDQRHHPAGPGARRGRGRHRSPARVLGWRDGGRRAGRCGPSPGCRACSAPTR